MPRTGETSSCDSLCLDFDDVLDAKFLTARTLCGSSLSWSRPPGGDCILADLESDADTGLGFFSIGGSLIGTLLFSEACDITGL